MTVSRESEACTLSDATMELASVRPGHGIYVRLKGSKSKNFELDSANIDIHGPIWSAMPSGLGTVVQLLLPLKLRGLKIRDFRKSQTIVDTALGLGLTKLSHKTLLERVEDGIKNGDPLFMITCTFRKHVPYEEGLLCQVPTKCSLIKNSLMHKPGSKVARPSIMFDGEVPASLRARPTSMCRTLGTWTRWWLLAMLVCVMNWLLYLDPHTMLDTTW